MKRFKDFLNSPTMRCCAMLWLAVCAYVASLDSSIGETLFWGGGALLGIILNLSALPRREVS